ncbi:hypothetical protein MBLNU230_g7579t1 [Neophaeotheca triangularis]
MAANDSNLGSNAHNHAHDPALYPEHQHQHQHLHHAKADNDITYTHGTTDNPSIVLDDQKYSSLTQRNQHGRGSNKLDETTIADVEKGGVSPANTSTGEGTEEALDPRTHKLSNLYVKYRIFVHIFIWLLFTAWWIAGLVMFGAPGEKNWVIPFLVWLGITIRLITLWVSVKPIGTAMRWSWDNSAKRVQALIPERLQLWAGAGLTFAVILIGTFVSEESADNTRENRAISLLGLIILIAGFWISSRNRSAINWRTVIVGFLMQYIVALFVLRTGVGFDIFSFVSDMATELLGFAQDGLQFLTYDEINEDFGWFIISVLPPIIFFIALVQVLFYWGLIQWFIRYFSTIFHWSMKVSGAVAVVNAATPFVGQGESAMLIKPFIPHLTKAEIHQVMASGFATIAGSVLVAFIGLGINPQALVSACVMSIPASLALSAMRYPETEPTLTDGQVVIPDDDEEKAANALHAFANGAWLGIKIAGMIAATLLCILAFLGLVNGLLSWWGGYFGLDPNGPYALTVQLIVSYICYPIAFLLGVSREGDDIIKVARLLGTKIIANEFAAYVELTDNEDYADLSPRSLLIATFALCGFGNIGSLGTQIGVLSQIAPNRAGDVSRVAVSALITGIFSTLSSASIAGLVVTDERGFT